MCELSLSEIGMVSGGAGAVVEGAVMGTGVGVVAFLNNCHDKKPIVIKNYFDVSKLSWNKINPTLNTFKRDCNKPPKTRQICT